MGHINRCKKNVRDGLSVFLIVPDMKIASARALLDTQGMEDKVAVESVESFVGQNISELAEFAPETFRNTLGDLLREYNRRVAEVETEGSLAIQIPTALNAREV